MPKRHGLSKRTSTEQHNRERNVNASLDDAEIPRIKKRKTLDQLREGKRGWFRDAEGLWQYTKYEGEMYRVLWGERDRAIRSDATLTGEGTKDDPLSVVPPRVKQRDETEDDAPNVIFRDDTLVGDGSPDGETPIGVANPFTEEDEEKLDGIEERALRNTRRNNTLQGEGTEESPLGVVAYEVFPYLELDETLEGEATESDPLRVTNPFTEEDEEKLDGIEERALRNTRRNNTLQGEGTEESPLGVVSYELLHTDETLAGENTEDDPLRVNNPFTEDDESKLDGIEEEALRNTRRDDTLQGEGTEESPLGVVSYELLHTDETLAGGNTESDPLRVTNPFTEDDETKLDDIEEEATKNQAGEGTTIGGDGEVNVDNLFTEDDETKLDGIEEEATKNQAGEGTTIGGDGEVNVDNPFTEDDETKLDGIEEEATKNQAGTGTTIGDDGEVNVDNPFTEDDESKLDGIEEEALRATRRNSTLTGDGTPDSPLGVVSTTATVSKAQVYSRLKTILVAGENITLDENDGAQTITINATTEAYEA